MKNKKQKYTSLIMALRVVADRTNERTKFEEMKSHKDNPYKASQHSYLFYQENINILKSIKLVTGDARFPELTTSGEELLALLEFVDEEILHRVINERISNIIADKLKLNELYNEIQ